MNPFELYNPTKLIFGIESFLRLSHEIPKGAKILMTYGGGSIKSNGVYDQVLAQLMGFQVLEFGGIEANPTFETLSKALDIIRSEGITFLLAVGGGSVIDGTKFLAAAAYFEGDSWDILKKGIRVSKAMPFGTVLTLPATGSEMNSGAVITRKETGEKLGMGSPALFPQFSCLNPEVIKSLPLRQLKNGIVDAYTHVLEQYMTYPIGAELQDRISESIIKTLIDIAPKVIFEPYNQSTASNFMWCCTMALNGLIQKGVPTDWATHMIGHELTAKYEIDHAMTLAIIFPNLWRYKFENKKEKLAQYAERIWDIRSGSVEEKAELAIQKTVDFLHSIEVKTKLSEYTENYNGFSDEVKQTFEARNWIALGERKDITPEDVKKIVEMSC
jgi:NADP-dependent alcohol dehydrogenase